MFRFSFIYLSILSALIIVGSCGVQKKESRYINKTYKELKTTFPEAQVTIVNDSIKLIFPNNILFATNEYKLKSAFDVKLQRFASIMQKYSQTNLLISGYTDNSGESESNLKLSLKRAESVREKLLNLKVSERRLFTWGLGEKNPVADNATAAGREKNRRVEFIVLYNPK